MGRKIKGQPGYTKKQVVVKTKKGVYTRNQQVKLEKIKENMIKEEIKKQGDKLEVEKRPGSRDIDPKLLDKIIKDIKQNVRSEDRTQGEAKKVGYAASIHQALKGIYLTIINPKQDDPKNVERYEYVLQPKYEGYAPSSELSPETVLELVRRALKKKKKKNS